MHRAQSNRRRFALWVALAMVGGALVVPACGDSQSGDAAGGAAGQSGAAGNSGVQGRSGADSGSGEVTCGTQSCAGVTLPIPGAPAVPACCPAGTSNACGLDSSFLAAFGPTFEPPCQALHQPGELDSACPDYPGIPVGGVLVGPFPGCCRADSGKCGFVLDSLSGLVTLGLGCVDATPFLDGGVSQGCGATTGEGGAGGAAGASGTGPGGAGGGVSGAAGASGSAGTAGESGAAGAAGMTDGGAGASGAAGVGGSSGAGGLAGAGGDGGSAGV